MIKPEVLEQHIALFPRELPILRKFESDFEIVWAKRYVEFNAQVSAYFLKPLKHMSETFGFESEVVLIYSEYRELQARTIQALDRIMSRSPALGRVDQGTAIIVSEANDVSPWLQRYAAENPQSRMLIGLSVKELNATREDSWDLRNLLSSQLFSRDLFDYSLPLNNDLFFFGRSIVLAEHVDAIRRSENRGLFGLRKSGKTSLLFKIQRESERNGLKTIYIDCKLPAIYRLSGDEFLDYISIQIAEALAGNIKGWKSGKDGYSNFVKLIKKIPDEVGVCIILDEIEFISFMSPTADHWKKDFVPVWQTIWSTQSQYRKLSFIVTGVNAAVVEMDSVTAIQNPMFGIVKSKYLTGFDNPELEQMLRTIGRRMGLRFSPDAVAFLHVRYGGHPLLTRMICSHLHAQVRAQGRQRPFEIDRKYIEEGIEDREEEIVFYCNHIVSELKQSYPDEYEMLELLAIDDIMGFRELANDDGLIRHLRAYGLVDFSQPSRPRFKIPVLKKFIAREWRRKTGQPLPIYIVPPEGRAGFVLSRASSTLRDLRSVDRQFKLIGTPTLYNGGGPAEAERFAQLSVVDSQDQLMSFLNQAQRSLVEPIDKYGKATPSGKQYFFSDIRNAYPQLWDALNRIRAYRNWVCHLELNKIAEAEYRRYVDLDLGGKEPPEVQDGYFRVQSAILNGLAVALQATLADYE